VISAAAKTNATPTAFSFAQLEALWIKAGGSAAWAPTMAGVALAESGGDPSVNNYTDNNGTQTSWGLWQISNGTHSQPIANINDPLVNAQQAVAKLNSQGIGAWAGDMVGKLATANKGPLPYSTVLSVVKQLGYPTAGGLATEHATPAQLSSWITQVLPFLAPGASLLPQAAKGVGTITSIGKDVGAVVTDLTKPGMWVRIGEGLAGIALIIGGFVLFVSTSDTGKKAIETGAVL
jgi:hypothetical protein